MTNKAYKTLKVIKNSTFKEFGVISGFYRFSEDGKEVLDLLFFIRETRAGAAIGFINSLASLLEKDAGIKINVKIEIVSARKRKITTEEKTAIEKEDYKMVTDGFPSLSYA